VEDAEDFRRLVEGLSEVGLLLLLGDAVPGANSIFWTILFELVAYGLAWSELLDLLCFLATRSSACSVPDE